MNERVEVVGKRSEISGSRLSSSPLGGTFIDWHGTVFDELIRFGRKLGLEGLACFFGRSTGTHQGQ